MQGSCDRAPLGRKSRGGGGRPTGEKSDETDLVPFSKFLAAPLIVHSPICNIIPFTMEAATFGQCEDHISERRRTSIPFATNDDDVMDGTHMALKLT